MIEPGREARESPAGAPDDRPLRVLIVDDDPLDRTAVRRALHQSGIPAVWDEASRARETFEHLTNGSYDVILLDWYLPDVDGREHLKQIRQAVPNVPIVIFTGRGDEDIAVELMKSGAADYLPKASLTPERLASSLRHAMEITRAEEARARAERELRVQEERYRTMINSIPQLAWMGDADGVLYWFNERWREYTGLAPETALAERQALIHPDHRERVLRKIREQLALGEPWEETFPLRRRDGEYRWFLTRAVPIRDASDGIVSWFGTNTDVTRRLEMENALRANESDLRRAIRLRDEMIAVVAHDLRNPVHTIVMSASTLLDIPLGEEERTRHLAMIRRAARGMERLISDLLDVSQIESHQFAVRQSRVAVPMLLDETVEMFEPQARERGIRLVCDAGRDLPPVSGDHDRLVQVLSNLIGNALQFTPPDGEVRVEARESRGREENEYIEFVVSDTGSGIAPDHLPNVFDRFWRGERQARSGAGLGLAIAKGIVEAHRGEIWVESIVGQGATFHFTIPCALNPAEPDPVLQPA